ncbi:MAG: type II toxin-antitoxin system VapC family toxin [Desulfobacterales bacterium]
MKHVVVDASVVLKWYLIDEILGEKALSLLENHHMGRIALLAPELLAYELANGLVLAARRGRIAQDVVLDGLKGFWALQVRLVDAGQTYKRLPYWCHTHNLTAYDAAYAATAEIENAILITADDKLWRAVKAANKMAIRLSELEIDADNEVEWPEPGFS